MALILKDRVKQQTTTTGTGTYTLSGSFDSFQTFAEIGDGNTTYYCCTDGTDFEIGIGTYTASGTTLARTTILQSSNSDAAVNWTSGTRTIFCTQPADKAVLFDASDNIELGDGQEIRLGDSDDFIMTHNGANTVFHDAGDGGFVLRASQHAFKNQAGTEFNALFTENGAVELYCGDVKKFETTADGVTITSTDAGADEKPTIKLFRDSSSPADNDQIGEIEFVGKNDAAEDVTYTRIFTSIQDASDGTEDCRLEFKGLTGGAETTYLQMKQGANFFFRDIELSATRNLRFEGSTSDNFETTVTVTDPTTDRTITLPDATGTVALENGNAVLLNTTTVTSAVSSVDFGSSLITDDFDNYLLVVEDLTVSANTDIRLRFGTANSADTSAIYTYNIQWRGKSLISTTNNAQSLTGSAINQTNALIMGGVNQDVGTAATQSANFTLHLQNLRSTTFHKTISGVTGSCFMTDTAGANLNVDYVCSLRDFIVDYQNTSVVNFISIFETDLLSQISGGTFSLYGLKT